jgi:drug/metabolite transporter (DMT)-like permease
MTATAQRWRAITVLFWGSAGTGVSFVLGKASFQVQLPCVAGESTWFMAAQNMAPRLAIGVGLLVALYGVRVLRLTAMEWRQAWFMAVTSFAGCLFQLDGLQYTTASVTAFLTQFYVILIPLGAALVHRRRPGPRLMLAGLMVLAGMALLAHVDWRTFHVGRGEAEVLAGSVFIALLIGSLNWRSFAGNRPERATAGMFAVEAAMFAGTCLLTVRAPASLGTPWLSPAWLALMAGAALLGTAGPFILMTRWQRVITATEAGLIYSFAPIFSALAGWFLPGLITRATGIGYANERVTASLAVGGLLVIGANVLIQLRPRPEPA